MANPMYDSMDNSLDESMDNSLDESMDNLEILHNKILFKWDTIKPLCDQASALTTKPAVPDYALGNMIQFKWETSKPLCDQASAPTTMPAIPDYVEITNISIPRGESSDQQNDEELGSTHQTEPSKKAERDNKIELTVTKIYGVLKREEEESTEPVRLVLNSEMFSGDYEHDKLLDKSTDKEVTRVKDKKRGKDLVLKTVKNITFIKFNRYGIRAWVSLADEDSAPELYCFQLHEKDLQFFMEPLQGQTLEKVIDDGKLSAPMLAKDFALCVLYDLLDKFEKLKKKLLMHGDIHGGNVMLQPSLQVKLMDFENATSLLNVSSQKIKDVMKNDIDGIASIFCSLFIGKKINACEILQQNKFKKLKKKIPNIDEKSWSLLEEITRKLFGTVRGKPEQERFGDISEVADYVKSKLPKDVDFKTKVGDILFPEHYQGGSEIPSCPVVSQDGTVSRSIADVLGLKNNPNKQ